MSNRACVRVLCDVLVGISANANRLTAAEEGGVRLRFSTEAKPVTVSVSGTVTDNNTGRPIPNALVRGHIVVWRYQGPDLFERCPYLEMTADASGQYRLEFVTPLTATGPDKGKGTLCVYASAPGYETLPQHGRPDITAENSTFADFNFKLSPGKRVAGVVKDKAGLPVEGAVVRVQNSNNSDWNFFGALGRTITDKDGGFEVWIGTDRDTMTGDPWLNILKPGSGTCLVWDILAKEDMGELVLNQGGDITGRVVDADGRPVQNCEVSVRGWFFTLIHKTVTDKDGRYLLKGIPGDPSIVEFYKRKNRSYMDIWGQVDVHARLDSETSLSDAPQYKIMAKDGQTLTGPDLAVGIDNSVSGTLLASKTALGLGCLMVRMDTSWDNMVEADIRGRFHFPSVSPGRHTLTAYLPYNLRYDRGIGRTQITVEPGMPLKDIQIPLEDLAEQRVQFLDANGNPLAGVTPSATWSKNGDGLWTLGTVSDSQGWAVLYLYPDEVQYVRGFDRSHALTAETVKGVAPKPGQAMEPLRIVMLPPATLTARLLGPQGTALSGRDVLCTLIWADGLELERPLKTALQGQIEIPELTPGIVTVTLETVPLEFRTALADPIEILPGQTRALQDVTLQEVGFHTVTGRLLPSETFTDLEGLKIRLDLKEWEPMVTTDANGGFVLAKVPDGKHRLTAYLPFNLRTDRGVGHTLVEVKGSDRGDVQLGLETLSTIHMTISDESGKPLEGISAAAWWTEDHSGVFTEGSKSNGQGQATLYLYPGETQYVGAHDWSGKYTLTDHTKVTSKTGEVIKDLKVMMRPSAR